MYANLVHCKTDGRQTYCVHCSAAEPMLWNILKKIYFQDDTASDKDKEYKFEILFGF